MLAGQIVRADFAARSLPRSASVREFAAREFPREDSRWVASVVSEASRPKGRARVRWGRLLRSFGTPRKAEPEADPAPEPTATA
ncbi:MAG: hypothetical protein ABSE66_05460 [Thermoplasmata archaeon]|jgi:hypothetical protein